MKNINLKAIKSVSLVLSQSSEKERNTFLKYLGKEVWRNKNKIITANNKDVESAQKSGLSKALIDRLMLNELRIQNMLTKIEKIHSLKSPLNKILEEKKLENGLKLKKICTAIGVILVIYEARPEATIDISSLCIKSGNAVILKGGYEALNTNKILHTCISKALIKSKFAKESVMLVNTFNRKAIKYLLKQNAYIDLVVARGSYKMVKNIFDLSKIPVLAHSAGGARMFIDRSADLRIAQKIILNSKISMPSACNSVDTILIHEGIDKIFISSLIKRLKSSGVKILGDRIINRFSDIDIATKSDWNSEFLDLKVAIKMVKDVSEAIEFIGQYGKKHSEGIVARDKDIVNRFVRSIDAAGIFINCSTRLHDGYIFGMGSEIGISTGKLHARGPVGLGELTSYRWEVYGNGQTRE